MADRNLGFAIFCLLAVFLFWSPLKDWARISFQSTEDSHVLWIPPVTAGLVYWNRREIFKSVESSIGAGSLLLLAAAAMIWGGRASLYFLSQNDHLSLTILSMVILWLAGFLLCYGSNAFRAAAFPLSFLFLMVPIPRFLLEPIILGLQQGSTTVAELLFKVGGVHVVREGFTLALSGLNIEVARECSGIHSSVVLFIMSLLAGHLFLRSAWRKGALTLFIVPLVIIKNALRIVTISLLTIYVDQSFMSGRLHRQGGILFFLMGLVILSWLLRLLLESDKHQLVTSAKSCDGREF